jgi:hypothetical protein
MSNIFLKIAQTYATFWNYETTIVVKPLKFTPMQARKIFKK